MNVETSVPHGCPVFPNTLTADALLEGRSEIRNRVIARVFKELGYIEQWGSGIQRIKSACIAQVLTEPRIREKGVIAECSRVLKRGKFCTIIVGTNNNQIGKILKQSPGEVEGLDDMLVRMGQEAELSLIRTMQRSIIGMSNTMRREQILLLQKQ